MSHILCYYPIVNLDRQFHLRMEKENGSQCFNVKWSRLQSGACSVKYEVTVKSASGNNVYNGSGYDIDYVQICNLTVDTNITDVYLNVSFNKSFKIVTLKASGTPVSTPRPTIPGMILYKLLSVSYAVF